MSGTAEYVTRLRAAAGRIRSASAALGAERLTDPDPESGERWDRGQVLAHVAEIVPYWTAQVELVLAAGGNGAPFGRVKGDQDRLDAIEADRGVDPGELLERLDDAVAESADLLRRLSPNDLARTGRHQRVGPMSVSRIVDDFIVGHLEEHADQLEAAAAATDGSDDAADDEAGDGTEETAGTAETADEAGGAAGEAGAEAGDGASRPRTGAGAGGGGESA